MLLELNDYKLNPITNAWIIDWIAGSLAGIGEVGVGHPLDTLKARVQTTPGYVNYFKLSLNLLKNENILGFYKGSLPAIINSSLLSAILFSTYSTSKTLVNNTFTGIKNENVKNYLSGNLTGMVMGLSITPLDRIKLVLQTNTKGRGKLIQQLIKTSKEEGIRGLFKGLSITLVRDMPGYGVYFGVYHYFRSLAIKKYGNENKIPIWLQMNIGGATGIVSWFFSYPMDVIKSRVQSNNTKSTKILPNIINVWNETQPRGKNFFKGVSITLVRAFPVNAISFTIYELVKSEITKS